MDRSLELQIHCEKMAKTRMLYELQVAWVTKHLSAESIAEWADFYMELSKLEGQTVVLRTLR